MSVSGTLGKGKTFVVQPGEAESHWQPVPAKGYIEIVFAPDTVSMEHPLGLGTQTLPPGGFVREHSHDRNEEAIYVVSGHGRAIVEGENHPMRPGTAFFIGKHCRHMFINDGTNELSWVWLIVPNGLEDFFRQIGRQRIPGELPPEAFPRPENVLEIERQTVFAPPPPNPRRP